MKALKWITGLILLAILLGGSAYLLASTTKDEYKLPLIEENLGSQLARRAMGGTVLAVLILYGISSIPTVKDEQFISFENEWGVVNVSIKAVTDFIGRLSHEFASIVSLDAGVTSSPNDSGIGIRINMRVKSGTNIPELSKMLQERTRESVNESLGVADVKSVTVNVREIVSTENADTGERNGRGEA